MGTASVMLASLGLTADVSMVMVGARLRPSPGVSGASLLAILAVVAYLPDGGLGAGGLGLCPQASDRCE